MPPRKSLTTTLKATTSVESSGKLNAHLTEIDKQAEDMFYRLVKEMAEKQGVTE